MTSVFTSAPGKVILSGEYAVLRGAPAISTAVDRRAVVQIEQTGNDYHAIVTPGYADGEWRFTSDDSGRIHWLNELPSQGMDLVEAAWRTTPPSIGQGLFLTIDTSGFIAATPSRKLGIGSSAAAMTALVGALDQIGTGTASVYREAGNAHKVLQQGLGSGVDIATSVFGGVIEFRTGGQENPLQREWPEGLRARFLWSGTSASTVDKIAALPPAGTDEAGWTALLAAAEAAAAVWSSGDVPRILDVYRQYTAALRQFSIDQDIGIFDAGHDELTDLATSTGLVYKPCGAGGGDIGIVMADEHDESGRELNQFCKSAVAAGFQLLSLRPESSGLISASGESS